MTDIKQKTKIGIFWTFVEKVLVQLIGFILNIVLARLLDPSDYGLIGMLTIFLTFSNVFVDSGFLHALIQKQNRTEEDFSTVLISNIFIGLILYCVLFLLAPYITDFYNMPQLLNLQRVFFIIIIINSFSIVQNAKLQININFKKIAIINTISIIVSGLMGIIAALYDWGPWALVLQSVSKAFISCFLFWITGNWIPKTGFSWRNFKNLFSFGSKLLVTGLLSNTLNNLYNLLIGKQYNAKQLGFYTRAQQFSDLTSGTVSSVLTSATFPLMASLQNDNEQLVITLKKLIRLTAMFVFPAIIGLAVLAKPIVFVLLGENWLPTAPLLFWLALSCIFTPLSTLNLNVLNAIGRSDLFLKVDLSKVPIIIGTMILTFPISMRAVVIGKAVTGIIYYYMNAFIPGRLYNFGAIKQLICSWKYIVASIIMGLMVFIINSLFTMNLFTLLFSILLGIIIYILILFILKDNEFLQLLKKLINKIKK